jgi:hypothetical protein
MVLTWLYFYGYSFKVKDYSDLICCIGFYMEIDIFHYHDYGNIINAFDWV